MMNAFAGPAGLEELAASLSWAGKNSLPFPDPAAAAVLEASPSLPLNQSGELLWRNELSSLSADPSADSGAWKGDPDTDLLTGAQHESSDGPSGLSFRTAVADGAGNSLATARDIGTLSGSQSFSDWVGKSDRDDFYRFEITEASQFSATLEGLSADADLQLLSSSGAVLASSTNARAAAEMISGAISAGTYYVRVYRYRGNTNYRLTLSSGSASTPSPGDGAGNSLESARDIGTLSGSQSFSDWVGKSDRDDFYRFQITEASQFSATLEGLSADADLQLLSSSGTVLASSTNGRSAAETITSSLDAGTYYARVYRYRGNTDYDLTVAATAAPPSGPTFRSTDGYGEASVERAIERLLDVSLADLSDRFSGGLYGLDRLGAPEVWNYGFTGEGMVVAVLDTGVDRNHADLDGNIWTNNLEIAGNGVDDDGNGFVDDVYGWNFAGNNNNTLDVNGHGTHVAGSIAAESNGFGVTGVAYNATIMPVKVLGDSGSGTYQGVAYGIRYAADNGADVINLSLGGGSGDSNVRNAIEYAWGLGVAVVMAAGNEGAASTGYPAAYASDWGIAVGAINNAGELASFSNRAGSTVLDYVTAAGVSVTSTTPGNSYATWSGTSMATPQVAGAMALLIEANRASGRNLSIAELEWLLMSTASNSSSATQLSGAGSTLLTGPSFQQAGPGASLPPAASSSESPATPAPEGASDLGDAASPVGSAEAVAGNAVTAELLSPALITWMGTPLSSDDWMITAMERSRSGADDGLDLLTGLRSRSRVAA